MMLSCALSSCGGDGSAMAMVTPWNQRKSSKHTLLVEAQVLLTSMVCWPLQLWRLNLQSFNQIPSTSSCWCSAVSTIYRGLNVKEEKQNSCVGTLQIKFNSMHTYK